MEKTTLSNGLRVVFEHVPHSRSVSAGLFVYAGSVRETPQENGLSHFIEHMLFKGTSNLTAKEISLRVDSIGAHINAFTSKEYTCYYVRSMDAHVPIVLPLIADMVQNSLLDPAELKKESGVILEEIAMAEDMPDDLVYEELALAQFGDSPLGQTILGPGENIERFGPEDLRAYMRKHYYPQNCVLAVAGNYHREEMLALSEEHFGGWRGELSASEAPDKENLLGGNIRLREKDIEQAHICLVYPGLPIGHEDLYALGIFNNIFGGSMSSRLFQRIREEEGMAYAVYSSPSTFRSCGNFTIYAGTGDKTAIPVLHSVREEIARMVEDGVTAEEFRWGKEQMRGGYILSQESASSRMMAIGRDELFHGRLRTEEEILKKIDAVTMEQVQRVLREVLLGKCSAAAVGRLPENLRQELELIVCP